MCQLTPMSRVPFRPWLCEGVVTVPSGQVAVGRVWFQGSVKLWASRVK